jgi:hypothetical protein
VPGNTDEVIQTIRPYNYGRLISHGHAGILLAVSRA